MQGLKRPYSPPLGYVDYPFTWLYDAVLNNLIRGDSYANQYIDIQSGYGDFVCRRILGLDTILAKGGRAQIRDMRGRYFQSLPLYNNAVGSLAGSSGDIALNPEQRYAELSQIVFDLYDIGLGVGPGITQTAAQLAFQGVRRVKVAPPVTKKYRPKPYTYVTNGALLGGTADSPVATTSVIQPVNNYDFDLYQVWIFFANMLEFAVAGATAILYVTPSLPLAAPPELVTVAITTPVGDNLPLTVTVNGYAVTIQPATNALGQITSTGQQVAAAVAANPAAAALITIIPVYPLPNYVTTPSGVGPSPVVGPTLSVNTSWATCLLFDQNGVQIANSAPLDVFVSAGSYYRNGAIVPPLHYQQNARIRMDITPQIQTYIEAPSNPLWATIHYVGEQRIPC